MNSRERILAIIVGISAVVAAVFGAQYYISQAFKTRRSTLASLDKDVARLKVQVLAAQKATKRVAEYEARSLPPQPEVARSLYQSWLLDEVGRAEMIDQQVRSQSTVNEGDTYVKQSFIVSGKGTLAQVVELLHAIYRVDYLQRVTQLSLKPIKESKLLDMSLTIEAVSMKSAAPANQLSPRPNPRLTLATRDQYAQAIVGRNLFAPPNQPPNLSSIGKQKAYTGRSIEFQARASDADALDRVMYQLVKSADPSAKFDPTSGRFSWTPKQTGEYQFLVRAADDGLPVKTDEELVTITVTEPPPPQPEPPPRAPEPVKLAFDDAKYTVLTAVIDVSGEGEVWLLIRPKGRTMKLKVGDKFEIGSVKGVVASIGQSDFTFEVAGKKHKLDKGETLEQAVAPVKTAPTEAARASEAE